MEDVLEVYHRPYDERRPLVALDEASKQLVGEVVQPLPPEPGQPERFDYEYVRNGTANLFSPGASATGPKFWWATSPSARGAGRPTLRIGRTAPSRGRGGPKHTRS